MLQTGLEAGLLTEIAGKGYYLHRAFLSGVKLTQIMKGCICTSIIHKDDLKAVATAIESADHRFLKSCHIFCLIIAGDNKG